MGLKLTTQALTYARTELIKVGESFIFDKVGDMIYATALKPNRDITGVSPSRQMYWRFTATGALTGGMTGLEMRATFNGSDNATVSITGAEIKARHTTGNAYTIGQLRGLVGNVDTKNAATTTAYGVEGSIDVGAGGTITTAACFHGNLNNSGTVTNSYGAYLEGVSGYNLTYGIYMRYITTGIEIASCTTGISITGANTDAIKIASTSTDGIEISGACTNCINITSVGSAFGLLYNVDMPTQIGSHVEGIKIILERTADVVIGTTAILGAEFIIKQGSDSYAAGMAPQITGVRIAMGGANTKATVYGLKCETQSNGFVNYLGMFSVNAGCTLGSGGAVVTVRSYVAADDLLKIEQIGATTAARGLLICDNVGTGTMTNVIEIDARNSDALIKFSSGNGALVNVGSDSMTKNPEGDTEDAYITIVIGSGTYQVPAYAA